MNYIIIILVAIIVIGCIYWYTYVSKSNVNTDTVYVPVVVQDVVYRYPTYYRPKYITHTRQRLPHRR